MPTTGAPQGTSYSPAILAQALDKIRKTHQLAMPRRLCIAYSGGLDTRALLHSINEIKYLQPIMNVNILAFHVNHRLSTAAAEWEQTCAQICLDYAIPFESTQVQVAHGPGLSIEEQARAARYAAIATRVRAGDWWLTAHHQDDQAETLLLQLLRGAGSRGLAAMPEVQALGEGWLIRPLLQVTRAQLAQYALQNNLAWIEDPSNRDERFARNFLRHRVLPTLAARWPGYAATLGRSAQLAAEAAQLADDLAALDMARCGAERPNVLRVDALLSLPAHRLSNVLVYWLRTVGLPAPYRVHIEHIINQVLKAVGDATPKVAWPGADVRRYAQRLYAMPPLVPPPKHWSANWDGHTALEIPGSGSVSAGAAIGEGLKAQSMTSPVEVRLRSGGERMQLPRRAGHHLLKHLFQEARIPPWQRASVPLVYVEGELACVPGIGVAEGYAAGAGEPGIVIEWLPRVGW
ncbi:MAG: tRNA lysidine(34) synthetase TilS [Pseudomonadota bacterium]